MSPQLILDVILVLGLLVLLGYRQSTWRPVDRSRMWRLPTILAMVGVVMTLTSSAQASITDVVVIVIDLVVSVGVGIWMGAIAHFRRLPEPTLSRGSGTPVLYETRTSAWGLLLWVIVIAVRVGIEIAAASAGVVVASSTGIILVLLAANRLARISVLLPRVDRHALAAA